jgi:anthranilate phosphoribosyltransferase
MAAADHIPVVWLAEVLGNLLARRDLSADTMARVMDDMLAGRCSDSDVAALFVAFRMKGETAIELAAAAEVLRSRMTRLDAGRTGVLDTCGMGGDGTGTFNISTATAIVAAGAGVPVVKHGNRAISSRSGSADVLHALGVKIDGDVAWARRSLQQAGLAFCYAPQFHPALGRFAQLRRRLGVRTLLNLLGPLANPACADHQLLGVARPELLDPLAGALARLGTKHALLVCSTDGLDEVSLSSTTQVREVCAGRITAHDWSADDLGLEPCTLAELRADTPAASAAIIRQVLDGQEGGPLRIVLANAAAALVAANRAASLRDGVEQARAAIVSGEARQVLNRLVKENEPCRGS